MRPFFYLISLAALSFLSSPGLAQTDQAKGDDLPSAVEVLKRYTEVTGGAESYKAIKSMVADGAVSMPKMGIEGTMTMKMLMPDKVAVLVTIDGIGEQRQGTNGEYSWTSSDIQGTRLLDGKEADQLTSETQLKKHWAPEEVYSSMKNAGVEDVDGKPAYRIELVKKSGTKQTDFYDVKSGLMVKSINNVEVAGMGEISITTAVSDFRKTGKITSPHKMVQLLPGGNEQVIEFNSFEYNVDIPDSEFSPPAEVQKLIDKQKKKID